MTNNKKKWTSKNYIIFTVICILLPFVLASIGDIFNGMGINLVYRIFQIISTLALIFCPLIAIIGNIIGIRKNPGNKAISVILFIFFGIILLVVLRIVLSGASNVLQEIIDFLHRIFYVKID